MCVVTVCCVSDVVVTVCCRCVLCQCVVVTVCCVSDVVVSVCCVSDVVVPCVV